VPLDVEVVEPTGASIQIYARLGQTQFCVVTSERHEVGPGDRVTAQLPPERLHLFDAETGLRL
jgi:multiple sugar transport system ATP-binding protein